MRDLWHERNTRHLNPGHRVWKWPAAIGGDRPKPRIAHRRAPHPPLRATPSSLDGIASYIAAQPHSHHDIGTPGNERHEAPDRRHFEGPSPLPRPLEWPGHVTDESLRAVLGSGGFHPSDFDVDGKPDKICLNSQVGHMAVDHEQDAQFCRDIGVALGTLPVMAGLALGGAHAISRP